MDVTPRPAKASQMNKLGAWGCVRSGVAIGVAAHLGIGAPLGPGVAGDQAQGKRKGRTRTLSLVGAEFEPATFGVMRPRVANVR